MAELESAKMRAGLYYGYIDKMEKRWRDFLCLPQAISMKESQLLNMLTSTALLIQTWKKIIVEKYIYASNFYENLAVVYKNGGFLFINKKGEIAINQKFDYATNFKYGLAKAWKDNELFYINKADEKIFTLLNPKDYKQKLKKP